MFKNLQNTFEMIDRFRTRDKNITMVKGHTHELIAQTVEQSNKSNKKRHS